MLSKLSLANATEHVQQQRTYVDGYSRSEIFGRIARHRLAFKHGFVLCTTVLFSFLR